MSDHDPQQPRIQSPGAPESAVPSDLPAALNPACAPPPERWPRRALLRLPDGTDTSVYIHAPLGPGDRLPVLYLHGIQSHCGWYVGSSSALADAGHAVYQVTRRGSGDSLAPRGHARGAGQLLRDVDAACRFVLDQTGAPRLHVLAVSWGGKLAAAWALAGELAPRAASLTLIAPGMAPKVAPSAGVKIGVALTVLAAPRLRWPIPLADVALFTDHEPMREYLRRDPLQLHRATSRFLYASRCLDRRLRRAPRGAITTPTTLLLAERDRIIDNRRTREIVDHLTAGAARTLVLPGCHSLEFEPDPQPLYDALLATINRAEQGNG